MNNWFTRKVEHDPTKLEWDEFLSSDLRKRKLNPRQKAVIMYYTSPDSPTYGNMVGSYGQVFKGHTGHESLRKSARAFGLHPHIQKAIHHVLEENGFGIENRIQTLAEIGSGRAVMTKEEVTKDGEVVVITVKPTFGERMKAVEIANKVDGTYAKVEAAREIAVDEHKRLQNKLVQELADGKR